MHYDLDVMVCTVLVYVVVCAVFQLYVYVIFYMYVKLSCSIPMSCSKERCSDVYRVLDYFVIMLLLYEYMPC
jgi:hypothetical protein